MSGQPGFKSAPPPRAENERLQAEIDERMRVETTLRSKPPSST